MTEIREYRGKRLDNGEWVYGMPYADYMICGMTTAYYDDEVPMSEYREFDYVEVDPETVGQWSGELNYEGQKIFKGDYIETWDTVILIREMRGGGLSPFRQTKNGFTRMTNWDHAIHGKIIGTIHDKLKGGE